MSGDQPECSLLSSPSTSSLSKLTMSSIDVKPKILCGRERPVYKHAQHTHRAFESLNEMRRFVAVVLILIIKFKN